MALTPEQRKRLLGFGGLKRVRERAQASGHRCTAGHASQVNSELRFDQVVVDLITEDITSRHPHIESSEVWPKRFLATRRAIAV